MKTLYPAIEPYNTFYLDTGTWHRVRVEECGNPSGFPVIFLHGGPASGCKPDHRRFFDPVKFRVILFDQRGSGLSMPYGELENNTSQDLVEDMERIRRKLQIDRWMLFGGSWGGALALLYAQHYPENVAAMIVRGVFLARQCDLDWFVKDGVNRIYPEHWQRLRSCLPDEGQGGDPIQALCRCLWRDDELARLRAAKEWLAWSSHVALGNDYDPESEENLHAHKILLQVRMEMHYARNRYFLEEDQILANCDRIPQIPMVIIHGRDDLVCPLEAGYSLHQRLPWAEFRILPNAGHVAQGEVMIDALVSATDAIAERLSR
ncbi:MAG: prolyl aminopeptidase [Pseudomonadota bacterium]